MGRHEKPPEPLVYWRCPQCLTEIRFKRDEIEGSSWPWQWMEAFGIELNVEDLPSIYHEEAEKWVEAHEAGHMEVAA